MYLLTPGLLQEVEKLRKAAQQAEAAAVAAAKAAAAAPPAPEEDPAEMSVQLATARRRVAELEVQLTLSQNRPSSAGSSNGASAERVAKLQKDLQVRGEGRRAGEVLGGCVFAGVDRSRGAEDV